MKLSLLGTLLLFAASAWEQSNPWFYQPLAQAKEFLHLSDAQLQAILTNNDAYNRWASEKQTRIRQVQTDVSNLGFSDNLAPGAVNNGTVPATHSATARAVSTAPICYD